jgi:polyisoprenoid-binding protein YceI
MKKIIVFTLSIVLSQTAVSQIYKAKDGATEVTFFSKSPLEDIDAKNKGAIIIMNAVTSDIQVRLTMQNFKFKNALMEEHFNENYLESEKYPNAVFKGKINEKIDYSVDGEHKVTVTGKMELHGVTKDETYEGSLNKVGNEILIVCAFKIKVVDYNIKVPSLYVKNIAEIVDVDIKSTLEPFVKK